MSVVAIFSASHCSGEEVFRRVAAQSDYAIIHKQSFESLTGDWKPPKDVIEALDRDGPELIKRIERGGLKNVAYLKAALAELISKNNVLTQGLLSLLLSRDISHILKVCLVADMGYRAARAAASSGVSDKDARSAIKKEDRLVSEWAQSALGLDPWDESNYDVVIPMNRSSVDEAVTLILECLKNDSVKTTAESRLAAENNLLALRVKARLAEKKHDAEVSASGGDIVITLKKYVVRLENHKNDLRKLALGVEGVKSVDFKIGPDFKMPSTWPPMDFDIPKKVLLVDDEREFVQTLSERLQRRKIETTIAYDGEEALDFVGKDQPEVMVLDLKMPGIDGIEVLRRIKKDHPETEVIILTGHGTDRERQLAAELGAFAYLEKPVDIEVLSETMKKAYAKVNLARRAGSEPSSDSS